MQLVRNPSAFSHLVWSDNEGGRTALDSVVGMLKTWHERSIRRRQLAVPEDRQLLDIGID
jgi:uncharacterized protein YjiS (DUF1127 family)